MKRIVFVLFTICLFNSCYLNTDLNDINVKSNKARADEYYWYYDPQLFHNSDTCQVVGVLTNYNSNTYINRQCVIYHDTIYVIKRYIAEDYKLFDGVIYIKDKEPFRLITELH